MQLATKMMSGEVLPVRRCSTAALAATARSGARRLGHVLCGSIPAESTMTRFVSLSPCDCSCGIDE